MKENNIHLSIMNKRKILFGIIFLAIIIGVIFVFLVKNEQTQYEDWLNNWAKDNKLDTFTRLRLSSEWFFLQIGWMVLITIITIIIGINTFSKKWTNQTRKALIITVIVIVSLALLLDTYIAIAQELPKATGPSEVSLNNQIKDSYDGFNLISNKWAIFLPLGAIILVSSILQLYLIGSIKKNADINYSKSIKKSEKEIKMKKPNLNNDHYEELP